MALAVGLVVSGCSGGKFLSTGQLFQSASSQPAPRSAEDPSARSELALARLSERRGQPEHAERLYQRLLEKDPQNPVLYHRLGVMRAKQGRFAEANGYFDEALRLAPSDATLLSDAGYCYYLQHRLEEAEGILARALELEPNDPAISNNLGVLLGEQGRDRECLTMFRRTGTEAEAYANMAFVYAQRGELEEAKASYSRALTLDQKLRPAAEALVQMAQYEQLTEPAPTPGPVPRAGSQFAGDVLSSPESNRAAMRPQISRTVGPLVPFPDDDTLIRSLELTDSGQTVSFEQDVPAAGPAVIPPARGPEILKSDADFASGLGDLVSQPAEPTN